MSKIQFIYFCDEWNGEEKPVKTSNPYLSGVDRSIEDAYPDKE